MAVLQMREAGIRSHSLKSYRWNKKPGPLESRTLGSLKNRRKGNSDKELIWGSQAQTTGDSTGSESLGSSAAARTLNSRKSNHQKSRGSPISQHCLTLALILNIYQKYVWFGRQPGTIHQPVGHAK